MVSLENVSLSYGDKLILDNFSIELPDTNITCFSGPSGCGKTTLFRLIAGLIAPQSGKLLTDRKKIAFMFQEDRLLPWHSALKNVEAVLPPERMDEAKALLHELGLGGELDALPAELSGGMRRRVALTRALVYGGDLLLLDEPFNGLETALIERLAALIRDADAPAYVITHSEKEAELLSGKTIRFKGPPLTFDK